MKDYGLGVREQVIAVMLKEVFERHPELKPELKSIRKVPSREPQK